MFKKYCLFIISFSCLHISLVKADILTAEQEILIEFYHATKGERWSSRNNWLSDKNTCSWYGITCLDNNLFKMNLPGNNLNGTLPESFANLDHLTHLNLSSAVAVASHTNQVIENKIQLPESFGNLTKLNSLILNRLTLTQLPDSFGNLQSLIYLEMEYSKLSHLPENFGNLTKLNKLILNRSALIQLPDSFGNLQSLTYLEMEYNQLSRLPENFGNLTKLNKLILNNLVITQLPDSFSNLQSLEYLEINYNQLSQLPESFGNLQNLEHLEINYNQLSQLPENFGKLAKLTYLELRDNLISELPNNFGNLTKLTFLDLQYNLISKFPDKLENLTQLISLSLADNLISQLSGNFENLTQLTYLNLSGNTLSDLPNGLQNLKQSSLISGSSSLFINLRDNNFIIVPLFISETSLEGNPVETFRRQSNTLFDWAETIFYDLFSAGNQQSQAFYIEDPNSPYFGQWYYRYYPDTQNYIASKPNQQRDNYDIYILGGSFGNDLTFVGTLPQLFETRLSKKEDITILNMDQRKAGEEFEYQYKTLDSEGVLRVKIKEFNDKQAVIESELTLNGKVTKTIETQIFENTYQYESEFIENSEKKYLIKEVIIESDKEIITLISQYSYSLVSIYYMRQSEKKLSPIFSSSNLTPNEQPITLDNERLKINAVNLKITIPAGTFDIIKQTLKKTNGQQIESWIDIKTGVPLIKRISDKSGSLISIQILK